MNPKLYTFTEIFAAADGALPEEVEILREGNWNGPNHPKFEITAGDIDEFAANANNGTRKGIPIDIEHRQSKTFGEQAVGWLGGIYATTLENGKRALMGKSDWNGLGKELVGDRRFRYVSAEFVPRSLGAYEDPEGKGKLFNVLKALTITNNPLMKDLKPLTATDGIIPGDGGNGASSRFMNHNIYADEGVQSVKLEDIRKKAPSAITADEKGLLETHKDELSLAERAAFGLDAATPPAKTVEPVKAADGTVTITAAEHEATQAKIAELTLKADDGTKALAQLKATKVQAEVEKHVARGAIKADEQTKWIERLIKADEGTYELLTESLTALPSNATIVAGEKGQDDKGAIVGQQAALDKVTAYATENKVDFQTAMTALTEKDVEFAKQLMPEQALKTGGVK